MSYTVVRLGLGVCGWLHTLVPLRGLSEPSFSDGPSSSDADRSRCGFRARDFMVPQATTHTVHPPAPASNTQTPWLQLQGETGCGRSAEPSVASVDVGCTSPRMTTQMEKISLLLNYRNIEELTKRT